MRQLSILFALSVILGCFSGCVVKEEDYHHHHHYHDRVEEEVIVR